MWLLDRLKNQRGAMFGMDGRITMVIFLTLTGVAGFIGFTRINTAKQTALLKEIHAIDEGLQRYQSNVGVFMKDSINGVSDGIKDFELLWDPSNVATGFRKYWSGPYTTIENRSHREYGNFSVTYGQDDRASCTHLSECYAWIELTNVPDWIWERINSYADESLGSSIEASPHETGRVQSNSVVADPRDLYFRSVKRP